MGRQLNCACVLNRKNLRDPGTPLDSVEEEAINFGQDLGSPSGSDLGESMDDEFQEPILMDGIPEDLKQQLLVVAPVLQGRDGIYDARFFTVVVGLCPRGVQVDQVLQQTPVTDNEILLKWKTRIDPYRFPMNLCVDNEQAAQFWEQHRLVYGGQSCNDAFSLRFLRACFATFVHKLEIDWISEAIKRRNTRMDQRKYNRHKLGPMAIREQLATLCAIVHSYTVTSVGSRSLTKNSSANKGSSAVAGAESKLCKLIKLCDQALSDHNDLLLALKESKKALATCGQDKEELQAQYGTTIDAAASLKREGNHALSTEKLVAGRDMLEKLIQMCETQEKVESSIQDIEDEQLDVSLRSVNYSNKAIAEAEEKLQLVKRASLVLRPRAPFVYPIGKSVPPMWRTEPKLCASCTKHGFVARAVIIASCGCEFHPMCIGMLMAEHEHSCPRCEHYTKTW